MKLIDKFTKTMLNERINSAVSWKIVTLAGIYIAFQIIMSML